MRTLLLADDSVTTQRVVALTFSDESFRVVTVSDGQQAIDSMAVMRPDIVLAGTTLPNTNGYELAEFMHGVATLKDVPVLLLSGAFESVDQARLKQSGARGVVEKPLEPTAVISRVKELLGLKDTRPAPAAGRVVTAVETPPDLRAPRVDAGAPPAHKPAPVVSSWDALRQNTGLEPDAPSVEGVSAGSGRDAYFDSLDAAFDSLDQHLAGRVPEARSGHRNPSPPLGQRSGAADPRSPGRRPPQASENAPPNAVFEVDADWFADDVRKTSQLAAQRDMMADADEAMPARPAAAAAPSVFEVDDDWFVQGDKERTALRQQQEQLAAEMGIHDVELPEAPTPLVAAAPPDGLDFDFGLDDLAPPVEQPPSAAMASPPAAPHPDPAPVVTAQAPVYPNVEVPAFLEPASVPPTATTVAPVAAAPLAPPPVTPPALAVPVAPVAPPAPLAQLAPPTRLAPAAPAPIPVAPVASAPLMSSSVADDFAALLAFETGDPIPPPEPPPAPAAAFQAVAPQITAEMLDQIAQRVADRLNAGTFGADLRQSMTATVRETVRAVVSDTSERLVRDEIARVKARIERDTP